jgi:hypothetical protein
MISGLCWLDWRRSWVPSLIFGNGIIGDISIIIILCVLHYYNDVIKGTETYRIYRVNWVCSSWLTVIIAIGVASRLQIKIGEMTLLRYWPEYCMRTGVYICMEKVVMIKIQSVWKIYVHSLPILKWKSIKVTSTTDIKKWALQLLIITIYIATGVLRLYDIVAQSNIRL